MKKKSEVGRDNRRIETLEKQVDSLKDNLDKINIETSSLEQKHFSLKREVTTLATQVDAALYTNAKLNVLIPNQIRLAIEEEAAEKQQPKDQKKYEPKQFPDSKKYTEVKEIPDSKKYTEAKEIPDTKYSKATPDLKDKDDILFDTSVSLDTHTDKHELPSEPHIDTKVDVKESHEHDVHTDKEIEGHHDKESISHEHDSESVGHTGEQHVDKKE